MFFRFISIKYFTRMSDFRIKMATSNFYFNILSSARKLKLFQIEIKRVSGYSSGLVLKGVSGVVSYYSWFVRYFLLYFTSTKFDNYCIFYILHMFSCGLSSNLIRCNVSIDWMELRDFISSFHKNIKKFASHWVGFSGRVLPLGSPR